MAHDYFGHTICCVYLFIADYWGSNINVLAFKSKSEPAQK